MSVKYLANGLELQPQIEHDQFKPNNFQWIGIELGTNSPLNLKVEQINISSTTPTTLIVNGETLINIPPVQNFLWTLSKPFVLTNYTTTGTGYINFGGEIV